MGEKKGLIVGVIVLVMVIATLAVYYFGIASARAPNLGELLLVVPLALIVVFGAYAIWDKGRAIKSGLPAEDELSKRTGYKAGYYAYMVALVSALAAGVLDLPANYVVGAVVICSAVAFAAAYIYLVRKGKVD